MFIGTVSGNVGKDAVLRDAGDTKVCSFSVASTARVKGEDKTTWIDVSIWGKRGESLAKHITKGTKLTVVGEVGTREHDGKTYITIRADHLEFGGGKKGDAAEDTRDDSTTTTESADIPF